MQALLSSLVAAAPLALLATGLVSSEWANRHARAMRRITVGFALLALVAAVLAAQQVALAGPFDTIFLSNAAIVPVTLGVYVDPLTVIMLLLISFIGCVIARYSVRYLDGDPTQGRFLRWISVTLGAVLLLVVSRNLVMFTAAWVLTSFGLHHLLTHYGDRPGAVLAARKKFVISRLGDVLLIAALVLTYRVFGSFEYVDLFAAARELQSEAAVAEWRIAWIASLFVLGAMTKSAQFPLHSWLPDTMETPTPVSALMHAGIINAGGFLVIRLSPLIVLSHGALDFLASVGAFTALFGAVVMLTQTSVKRSLAYSTVAQMGFMMLQCGLGAFSVALLHLVAHSLYKAHAFLSSGGVVQAAAARRVAGVASAAPLHWLAALVVAVLVAPLLSLGALAACGISLDGKPGAGLLLLILTVALIQLLWPALVARSWQVRAGGLAAAVLVSFAYSAGYAWIDATVGSVIARPPAILSMLDYVLMTAVGVGFVGVFLFQASLPWLAGRRWLATWYVHASNGFYVDIAVHRLVERIWWERPAAARG